MAGSRSGSDDFKFPKSRKLVLPDGLRNELKELLEPLTPETELAKALKGAVKIITVGDLVSLTIHRAGFKQDVCIVDFKTKRCGVDKATKDELCLIGVKCIRVKSPAAMITGEMWEAVRDAISCGENTRIEVEGEEDMASLICLSLAPFGTAVIYGIPDMGIEVVHVDERARKFANNILQRMTVV